MESTCYNKAKRERGKNLRLNQHKDNVSYALGRQGKSGTECSDAGFIFLLHVQFHLLSLVIPLLIWKDFRHQGIVGTVLF